MRRVASTAASPWARRNVGGETVALGSGDALVVPANVPFAIANPFGEPFEAICALPVGGRATLPGGEAFTPPWAS